MRWRLCGEGGPRSLCPTIRPLIGLCNLLGAFPYTAVQVPHAGGSTVGGNLRYRLVLVSFPSFVTLTWLSCTLFSAFLDWVEDPFEGEDEMAFLKLINTCTYFIYIVSYGPSLLMLVRWRSVEGMLDTLANLDAMLPTRGIRVILAQVVVFFIVFSYPLFTAGKSYVLGNFQGDKFGVEVLSVVIIMHVTTVATIYVYLFWVAASHLTEKFQYVNGEVEEAVRTRDSYRLQQARQLHSYLRSVARNVEGSLWPAVPICYFFLFLITCLSIMDIILNNAVVPLWLSAANSLGFPLAYLLTHLFSSIFASEAGRTVILLDCQDLYDDQFSRQVESLRGELRSTRVCFTVASCLDLNMQEYWKECQFMLTLVVVLIQFAEDSKTTHPASSTPA